MLEFQGGVNRHGHADLRGGDHVDGLAVVVENLENAVHEIRGRDHTRHFSLQCGMTSSETIRAMV